MIDPRFYEALGPMTVRALAPTADIGGDAEALVSSAAAAGEAGSGDLCYFEPRGRKTLTTAPAACIIAPSLTELAPQARALILSEHPRATFARIIPTLARPRMLDGDTSIDPSARIEEGVKVAPGVVVGANAHIGADSEIGANSVIGPGVAIGRRARIGPRVTIGFALIGDDVSILSGAVIGEQGFAIANDAAGLVDVPHLGRVIIQDRVTIGANTAVDRGLFGDTTLGEDVKVDNMCHIAHNCVIGRRTVIAAFAGISGSTTVGEGVMMGGRVGITDHRTIGPGATLAGASAVMQDVPAGEVWMGYPAKPMRKFLREVAWLNRKTAGPRNESD